MNFTVNEVDFEFDIGSSFGRGHGMPGLRRAPLNIIKNCREKHPGVLTQVEI